MTLHVFQTLLTRLHILPTFLLFCPCLIFILVLLVFGGRPLALHLFCCVSNKCLLSMSSLPCFCGTPAKHRAKGGDTASHYFIADEQQCVPWRLKKKIKNRGITSFFCLSQSVYFFLSHLLLHMSLFFCHIFFLCFWILATITHPVPYQSCKHTQIHTASPLVALKELVYCFLIFPQPHSASAKVKDGSGQV